MKTFFACLALIGGLAACASNPNAPKGMGSGGAGTGGTSATGGSGGAPLGGGSAVPIGGSAGSGGAGFPSGGVNATGGAPLTGGTAPGGAGTGAVPGTGAAPGSGGAGGIVGGSSGGPGSGGTAGTGAAGTTGGGGASGGLAGTGASGELGGSSGMTGTGGIVGPGTYALPPPSQCHNENDYQEEGCVPGDANSLCGGKCNVINACSEDRTSKPFADITFMCPRSMLFSPEMKQAVIDDGLAAFNYAVVGHDADTNGIDAGAQSTCCQCYQLVYAWPSPDNERQCQLNPDNPNPPASAIAIPKPLIVQSFNTAATPDTFDVYMAAGGLGANNACAPILGSSSRSGEYMYTSYPEVGQPSGGGVKPVTHYNVECKNSYQWVTQETLSSAACQDKVADACNEITSDIPGLTEQARESCIASNDPDGAYHLNWSVYVMKVECPEHLTQVTGCKLAPQGLPAADPNVTTAAAAAADPRFWDDNGTGKLYETTTMEDCCRPSCAATDWVSGRGLAADPEYNAFYSCDGNGVPITEQAVP